jgi:polysaccharide deacetylase family protein (PEP-CTERM system associated)
MRNPRQAARAPLKHIMSVDVEDYFQVEAFADSVDRAGWDQWPSRVVANTHRALDLLDEYQTRATFFFLGWVAERFPSLVAEVSSRGHELACHSYWHRRVYRLTPEEFRADTRTARDAIEQAGGARVLGYRAPSWSITNACAWAPRILAEEGFIYDSSIYPIRHDLYGVPGAPRFPYTLRCGDSLRLREYPPATVRVAGVTLPAAGGGYLRLFPMWYTRWAFLRMEEKESQAVVVYFHPWELDPEQPRIQGKLKSRFRHYVNVGRMKERLAYLLRNRSFCPFRDLLAAETSTREFESERSVAAVLGGRQEGDP